MDRSSEWLETDGLGGFAMGTAAGIRTRRYHAALLVAATPPTGRRVLLPGFDAFVERDGKREALSAQAYLPDVIDPDGASRIEHFQTEPWPAWTYRLSGGARIVHELFMPRGSSMVVLRWQLESSSGHGFLAVRPFLAARDYHTLEREIEELPAEPQRNGHLLAFRARVNAPLVWSASSGEYRHEAYWYRNFRYDAERARGLDFIEDLVSPGSFHFDLRDGAACLVFFAEQPEVNPTPENLRGWVDRLRGRERRRRMRCGSSLERAAFAYRVRRGRGKTLVAGYPWFTDWGRDTFISVRGLCLATGQLRAARDVLIEWAGEVSEGMLPNRFPDQGDAPEFNAVDASLWFVVAAYELIARCEGRRVLSRVDRIRLRDAVQTILEGYAKGTRHGIHLDGDGLLAAGEPGVQLTWMDARVGDWVVTPRIGKPVEIQALWWNALQLAGAEERRWRQLAARCADAFAERFWNEARGCLFDVVDVGHEPGRVDAALRPNQIFAIGGLPFSLLSDVRARRVVEVVEAELWTPLGLRTLARGEPGYAPRFVGGPEERDGAYHQGTVWPWLLGPFVEAWVRVRENSPEARAEASARFLAPIRAHLEEAGLGHISEVADAEPPHTPGGCPFQAWSLGELLRLERDVLDQHEGRNGPA